MPSTKQSKAKKRSGPRRLSGSSAPALGLTEELPATEEEALQLIKEALNAPESETDFDVTGTHVFIVLGASVSVHWRIMAVLLKLE